MNAPLIYLFLMFAILFPAHATSKANDLTPILEEVVVVGKRPGPPLWRVDNGERTLWIFGTLEPLPRTLEWDSESVDWIISQSQEYISPPYISASTSNPFKAISTVRKIKKLRKLPKRETLKDVIPKELFDHFVDAKSKFAPRNKKMMGLRPMFAARELSDKALGTVGLTNQANINQSLKKIAKKHGVGIVTTNVDLEIDQALNVFRDTSMEAEISCLNTTLNSINSDLQAALERALAWAEGDVTRLKAFDYPDVSAKCTDDIFNNSAAVTAREQTRAKWLASAELSLQSNDLTFASLPIRELIHPQGLLATLRTKGYDIRGQ